MQYYDVFVYGTLRKGGIYHDLMKNAVLKHENYRLPGYRLYDFQHWYPFLVKGEEQDVVIGEIYTIDTPMLQELHILEDIESKLYRFLYLPEHSCYIYEKFDVNVKGLWQIPSGDWITYINSIRA